MKNDDQMFQSVLLRRNEYRERKNKRIRTIRRTVPVLACFCLTIALGVGYWDHFRNLPNIPVQPNIIEEPTIETPDTTTASTDANTTVGSETPSEQASTTAPTSNSETERMTTTAGVQTQTVTTVVTDATEAPATEQVVRQTETQAPIVTEPITTTEWIRPVAPPVQPVLFTDISSAIDAINTSDVSSYSEQEQEVYLSMFDRINRDGILYQVNNTDTVSLIEDRGIALFPYAAYEDVGVGCYVRYKDINYHITFYYADHDLLAQTNSIAEYLQSRMGRRCDKEINVSDSNVSLFFADNGQTYAGAFIDSDHYYTVNTVASEEEMAEFIEALSFEPLPLV